MSVTFFCEIKIFEDDFRRVRRYRISNICMLLPIYYDCLVVVNTFKKAH